MCPAGEGALRCALLHLWLPSRRALSGIDTIMGETALGAWETDLSSDQFATRGVPLARPTYTRPWHQR